MDNRPLNKTPRFATWVASKLLRNMYVEEFLGDLQEMYDERLDTKSTFRANMLYWVDVWHLIFGFSSPHIFKFHQTMLLRNMLKIAWRNAIRQKQFTVLNLLGLSLGISVSLFIGLFIHDELTFDDFHENKDRIYRVNQPMIWGDWDEQFAATGPNVAIALREDAPEFEAVTRILTMGNQVVKYTTESESKSFNENAYFLVEENFFDVFSFEFMDGNPSTALVGPNKMILTQETSERYFGFSNAIGKTLEVKDYQGVWQSYKVTGVLENVPERSHLQFDMLVSFASEKEYIDMNEWKWIWTAFSTYGLVHPGTDIAVLEDKIQSLPTKWAPPTTNQIFNQSFEEFTKGKPWTLTLQPLPEIYASGDPGFHNFGPTGNPQFVGLFGAIGILVLLLSCINFMNLSTAKSSTRSREVGVRKVLGSNRNALIWQFIFESVLFVFVGTLCALLFVSSFLDVFNVFAQKHLQLAEYLAKPSFILGLFAFVLVLGIASGSYPAFYLSSFKPIDTLKGKLSAGFKGKRMRNALIIFQFTISITLIICTFFVQKQLSFASGFDVGYEKENVLQIHNIEQMGFDTEAIQNKLAGNPSFSHVGKSFGIPPNIWSGDRYKPEDSEDQVVQFSNFRTEGDYLDLLNVKFVTGRNFDKSNYTDRYKIILNEEAVRLLGWGTRATYDEDSPIGKNVLIASGDEDEMEVVGVVEDFNFNDVKREIGPLLIINYKNDKTWDYGGGLSFISLKLAPESIGNAEDMQLIIESVEKEIASIDPSFPFEYSFMDQEFENNYRSERRMGSLLNMFTIMALIIACLGLFGLAAFSAEQRIKELGIRKVIGANVSEIVLLFSTEFTRLIVVSIILASPIAYLLVSEWLSEFAYRTPVSIWVFVVAAGGALSIALATISYQTISAAYRNPIESLKDE